MLRRIGYFFSDVGHWLRSHLPGRRLLLGLGAIVLIAAVGYFLYEELSEDDEPAPAAGPQAVIQRVEADDDEAEELGFPAFATKNTTRISGADAVANAAAVALATFPSTGGLEGPAAVTLVDAEDWSGAIAAASLVADPVSAPVLFSDDGEVPELTTSALTALAPKGSSETEDKQAFRIGNAAEPEGLRSEDVEGQNPAELAAEVERLRRTLTGDDPKHVVIASSDEPAFAMPAAAWAARSGDPVLFTQRRSTPEATLDMLKDYENVPVYVLGPESAISGDVLKELEKVVDSVTRVAGEDPVANAIEFARFSDDGFGWNINDPGHGFVLANADRPSDAGAAAPLSASGTWGPLLVTDDPNELPSALRGYLLDLKPGYQDDPTRAVYNRVWIIGDPRAISVAVQAQVDELAELAKVTSGTGSDILGAPPGVPEPEQQDDPSGRNSKKDDNG